MPVNMDSLWDISRIKLHIPNDLVKKKSKQIILETLRTVKDKFGDDVPMMHPVKDMKIDNKLLDEYIERKEIIETGLVEIRKGF